VTTSDQSLLIQGGLLLLEGQAAPVRSDVLIRGGRIERIAAPMPGAPDSQVIRADGMLISPPFVESHVHLDSALVDGGRCMNRSGTLFEGIDHWRRIKSSRTEEDILRDAERTLRMQAEQGVLFVRTHADVSHADLTPVIALTKLRDRVRDWITVQVVAFPQDGLYAAEDQVRRMERAIDELGVDVIGGIPHYELSKEDGVRSLETIFELAAKYDRMIDVHCDEVDDPNSRFLEVMAAHAVRGGNGPRVTASHTTAFGSYDDLYAARLMGLVRRSGINIVANPLINIVLQGRADTYPKRRGVTRVKELWQAGVNVSLGYDCIMDPWYALGTGNMLDAAHMAVHVCHMIGREEIDACYDMVTWNGARTLGLDVGREYDLREGNPANLVILDLGERPGRFEAIRTRGKPKYVISRGRVLT
jgi:cytosine/creatinine deaminase